VGMQSVDNHPEVWSLRIVRAQEADDAWIAMMDRRHGAVGVNKRWRIGRCVTYLNKWVIILAPFSTALVATSSEASLKSA
jgi:hypothetical protein